MTTTGIGTRSQSPANGTAGAGAGGAAAGELRASTRLALPVIAVQLGIMLMSTIDTAMLGHLSAAALASAATEAIAGHQVAILLCSVSFMVPVGIAGAAMTRVGNAVGRADVPAARRTAAVCLGLDAGVMSLFAALFALAPRQLAALFTDDPAVVAAAARLLPIAAAFQVFDGTQAVSAGILRGTADTALPAAGAVVGYGLLALPAGWLLAFPCGLGPRGLWWGATLGLAIVAILQVARIVFRFRGDIARVG